MADFVAAIDQGTTSTRCMIFDHAGREVAKNQLEHEQIMPKAGWVEHDAQEIWQRTQEVVQQALAQRGLTAAEAWQARTPPTAEERRRLRDVVAEHEQEIRKQRGLLLEEDLGRARQASLDRRAVRRAAALRDARSAAEDERRCRVARLRHRQRAVPFAPHRLRDARNAHAVPPPLHGAHA